MNCIENQIMNKCSSERCKKKIPLVQCKYCLKSFCVGHLPETIQNQRFGHDCPKTQNKTNNTFTLPEKVEPKKIDQI